MSLNLIDTDTLIPLIHAHPILWDKTHKEYKNRLRTFQGWMNICMILTEEFAAWSSKEQKDYSK